MSASIPSNANPALLKWARTQLKMTVEFAASAIGVEPQQIEKWEKGDGTPSLPKLEELAKLYKRITPVFYLPEPPAGAFNVAKLKDFRTRTGTVPSEFSPEMLYAIRHIRELQEWASSALEDEGSEAPDIAGSVSLPADPIKIANEARTLLNGSLDFQNYPQMTSGRAFDHLRDRLESIGIYVFQFDKVEVSEMQGFALADTLAPAVAVNIADYATSKLFTLIHEFGHILLGVSAIVGFDGFLESDVGPQSERFCNKFAAEVLVPGADFKKRVPVDWLSHDNQVLRDLSKTYKVSRLMIALRLVETGGYGPCMAEVYAAFCRVSWDMWTRAWIGWVLRGVRVRA